MGLGNLRRGHRGRLAAHLALPRKTDGELHGLVWGLTEKKEGVEPAWYKRPVVLAVAVLAIAVALNIIFF